MLRPHRVVWTQRLRCCVRRVLILIRRLPGAVANSAGRTTSTRPGWCSRPCAGECSITTRFRSCLRSCILTRCRTDSGPHFARGPRRAGLPPTLRSGAWRTRCPTRTSAVRCAPHGKSLEPRHRSWSAVSESSHRSPGQCAATASGYRTCRRGRAAERVSSRLQASSRNGDLKGSARRVSASQKRRFPRTPSAALSVLRCPSSARVACSESAQRAPPRSVRAPSPESVAPAYGVSSPRAWESATP